MEMIMPALIELLTVLIYVGIVAASGAITLYMKEKWGVEKMQRIAAELHNKESIAYRSLQLIQEGLKENGLVEENLLKASMWASKTLDKQGIKVEADEIQDLITSVYNEFKDQLIEDWEDIISE